jgi:signal transduction histidine kinase
VESDRAVILAGISHDLRTPLARMQLEVEMANLSDEAREGMQSDMAQMDAIIGQFLDYAKPTEANSFKASTWQAYWKTWRPSLPACRTSRSHRNRARHRGRGQCHGLARVFNNLIENARRYGKTPGTVARKSTYAAVSRAIRWWWTSLTMARACRRANANACCAPSPVWTRRAGKPTAPAWAWPSSTASYSSTMASCSEGP